MLIGRALCTLPCEMVCHWHILVVSGELAADVDHDTLTASACLSETGTELDIMKPHCEELCRSGKRH